MSDPAETQLGAATRTLALLRAQADAARADLSNLRRELAQARQELSGLRTAQLVEVNEQLVQAAVHADSAAQTAFSSLDELTRSTQHDELTGVANRALMLDRLDNAIALAQRRGTRIGVMFLDLDHFKQINDTLGHAVGDQVLQSAAQRVASALRESDSVGRHSGDEFVVLLAEMSKASDAAPIARKILDVLAAPGLFGTHTLSLSASIGISVYPEDGSDAVTLIDCADAAMYRAKKSGPGRYAFCQPREAGPSAAGHAAARLASPTKRPDSPLAEHEARLRDLLEANKQLVAAAQAAQTLQASAEEAHHRQINFVAMAAHALRNPLSAIRMASATLGHPKVDEARRADHHQIIQRQAALMARLIDDLLDGSRVGVGEFRLQCSELRLDTILAVAVDACRYAIDAKQQKLRIRLPATPALVHGDPQRLTQVFSNLLNNASRRSPVHGELSLTMAILDDQVTISVCDQGARIAPEALPHVFELFSLDSNVPVEESGLGIGLAVVQALVRAHGGSVVARSAGESGGSEFVVGLPLLKRT
ncbi:MAG: diguanylate cyclase domain-containing protein [Caldimonas sp.]